MKKINCFLILLSLFICTNSCSKEEEEIKDEDAEYVLVWSDEFDSPDLDHTFWGGTNATMKGHDGGVITRTMENKNVRIEDGHLLIEAHKEEGDNNYSTGAQVKTRDKLRFQYGKLEMRAKLPAGKGCWPAFWLNGAGLGYSVSPEVDIFEMFGKSASVSFNMHKWWYTGSVLNHESLDNKGYDKTYTMSNGIFNDNYHVFGFIWTKEKMEFLIDDHVHFSYPITNAEESCFHEAVYIIVSMTVGSYLLPAPDENTEFPVRYLVDWVRLYQIEDYGTLSFN